MEECPKCHSALHEHASHMQPSPPAIEQLPYKSPGTAALIAFLGGIFALPGIGHIYVGKVGKGIAILVGGLVLYIISIFGIIYITTPVYSMPTGIVISVIGVIGLSIAYLVLFIWQIFNARKMARKFNEVVKATGKEPW